jgi:anti-sigma B factor antagonist
MVDERSDAGGAPAAADSTMVGAAAFRTERTPDGTTVVHVDGELDAQSGSHLRTLLSHAFEEGTGPVTVDLSAVTFVDSVGLSVLVAAHTRAEAEGVPFELHRVSPTCLRVLEITRLDQIFVLR